MKIEAKMAIKKVTSKVPTRDDAPPLEPEPPAASTTLISAHCDDAFPFESH